ncbi:response regulator [Melghirimyces algeriensis]|uniref:Two component transcriptional regulator, AraC family n=1 Tax=Melghirimyces algeriensis TaxID=910412 RepID=A0A521C251_9BACL|nr:response regulator [Melghirimyces algeriensis]SMO52891.1 two component transcriptional regulator, AraC family [Melghirimyces algeriensis]
MYRLLIAEDEPIEREAMRVMIERILSDRIQVVGEAENGRKAVEMAEKTQPDIIMMDIKMPGINGIDAIREIQKKQPDTRFILVTAYDRFQYAREAMRMGIKEYLLKPGTIKELEEAISNVVREIDEERRRREQELDLKDKWMRVQSLVETEWVTSLLLEHIRDVSWEDLHAILQVKMASGFAFVISSISNMNNSEEQRRLYETMKETVKDECPTCLVGPMMGRQVPVFVLWQEPLVWGQPSTKSKVVHILQKTIQALKKRFGGSNLFIGAGLVYNHAEGLRKSYREALIAARRPTSPAGYLLYDDLSTVYSPDEAVLLHTEKELLAAVQQGDDECALQWYDRYVQEADLYHQQDDKPHRLIELMIILYRGMDAPETERPDWSQFHKQASIEEQVEWGRHYLLSLIHNAQTRRKSRLKGGLERAKAYIHQHYQDNLTLASVAAEVNLNPYYFSKLFKEECNTTFIDYLTRVRIDQAKQLIQSGDWSLKEVCYQVGYQDPNYFSRVFKKMTGVPPSQYRKRITNPDR